MTTTLGAAGLLALLASTAWARQQPAIAITGATIIDGNGGEPRVNSSILIEGNRIAYVGQGAMNIPITVSAPKPSIRAGTS